MGSSVLGLALLLWFAGPLHARIGTGSCRPPQLANGYYSPEAGFYDRGDPIVYSCEKGHKPAAEGWWGTSLCQDGTWFPKPQCIDERACLPPEIPRSTFPPSAPTWYPHGRKIRITCDNGFELQNFEATALCENGSWSSLPVCTKSAGACGEPPQVPHAVVVNQVPQEVFPEDSKVRYQCKDGYEMEGEADERMFIYCMSGNWTEPPTCASKPCVLDAADHSRSDFKLSKVEYVKEGEERTFPCIWVRDYHTVIARCTAGKLTLSQCCRPYDREVGWCR